MHWASSIIQTQARCSPRDFVERLAEETSSRKDLRPERSIISFLSYNCGKGRAEDLKGGVVCCSRWRWTSQYLPRWRQSTYTCNSNSNPSPDLLKEPVARRWGLWRERDSPTSQKECGIVFLLFHFLWWWPLPQLRRMLAVDSPRRQHAS